jgi:hypothetical protein
MSEPIIALRKKHLNPIAMTINGKLLIWPDGRHVVAGEIEAGQTITFDPFTGVVSTIK